MSNQSNQTKSIESLRFFEPRTIEGHRKLVDINNGDFFAFGNSKEQKSTKELLTTVYGNVEIKESHHA